MGNGVNLFQFIVPLTFLAIWALTSLINREAQPLPPRTGRPPGPPGPPRPRPAGGPPSLARPAERRSEPFSRDASARRPLPANQDRSGSARPGIGADDGILIIESETRKPASTSSATNRRASRPRSAGGGTPKREEKATPRALSAAMGQEAAANLGRNRELTPLSKTVTPLSTPLGQESLAVAQLPSKTPLTSAPASNELAQLLKSPTRLREAIVLNEILQPPLALRGPRPRRI